jgi:hypothetical protein
MGCGEHRDPGRIPIRRQSIPIAGVCDSSVGLIEEEAIEDGLATQNGRGFTLRFTCLFAFGKVGVLAGVLEG